MMGHGFSLPQGYNQDRIEYLCSLPYATSVNYILLYLFLLVKYGTSSKASVKPRNSHRCHKKFNSPAVEQCR